MTREHYDAINGAGVFPSVSGQKIDLRDPWPNTFLIEDIAAGLSKVCRFGGQIPVFYSVAQHSILVSRLAPAELRLAALLHDAPEAYLGDIIKPLKILIADLYRPIERRFEIAICDRFGVDHADLDAVKPYDLQAYGMEAAYLRHSNGYEWRQACEILGLPTKCWHPHNAQAAFMDEYKRLTEGGLATFHGAD